MSDSSGGGHGSTEAVARVELTPVEARVLGVLVEKSFLTPDVYPMTTNAMVNACNQKTNRDPVVSYTAVDVDKALMEMRQRNIVRRVHLPGSRSTKHRHSLDEVLELDDDRIALISVLMLRGPQTLGELRTRTERYVGFEDLTTVEACLEAMASRANPLVRELVRQPGQKENRWEHLLGDPDAAPAQPAEVPEASGRASVPSTTLDRSAMSAPAQGATSVSPVSSPSGQDSDLVDRVAELEDEIATLRRQLKSLADKLGEPLD